MSKDRWQTRHRLASTMPLVALCCLATLTNATADDATNATDNATSLSSSLVGGVLMADKVLVQKSERRLYLLRHGQVLRSFRVALGLRPQGHKQQEGDSRTPEGEYKLIRRNPRSEFFLSMEVSYPNAVDLARAQRSGAKPGGAIMVHGSPNIPRKTQDYYQTADWTDGCIAVSNSDMVEIWLMTPIETPIEIRP